MTILQKMELQGKASFEARKLKAEILHELKKELLAALHAAPTQVESEYWVTSFRLTESDVYVTLRMPGALFQDS